MEWEFTWNDKESSTTLVLHDISKEEAYARAIEHGWREPVWWNPRTWGNSVYRWEE